MRKDTLKFALAAVLSGFMIITLNGCGQKTVKVDQAEETATIVDAIGAQPSASDKAKAEVETAATAKIDSSAISEGAGPPESLETMPTGQEGVSGLPDAVVVEGSRTNVGLLPIYFDFDKSIVRPDQVERVEANALFLKENPEIKVRVEGNCDDRGTNEYNMALGERRAMGAMKYLVNLGVAANRLSTLSYGEERPLNMGNDEVARAENRRGDFVIVR